MTTQQKFEHLKAWTSGKAYNKPTHFLIVKLKRGWKLSIYSQDTYLLDFWVSRKKDLVNASEIIVNNLKTYDQRTKT